MRFLANKEFITYMAVLKYSSVVVGLFKIYSPAKINNELTDC